MTTLSYSKNQRAKIIIVIVVIIIIGVEYSYGAFWENNTALLCLLPLYQPVASDKVFLFVLLLRQKPPISEIIAIVD